MAVFSVESPTWRCFWISMFLLFIFIQMLTSMVISGGVLIFSSRVVISPEYGKLIFEKENYILITIIILGLCSPMVLVAFAMLSMLLAAYGKDRATLWLGKVCQGASSLLLLIGIIVFLLRYRSDVSWGDMSLWFYICVGVQLQLIFTTVLTCVLGRKLTSDWK